MPRYHVEYDIEAESRFRALLTVPDGCWNNTATELPEPFEPGYYRYKRNKAVQWFDEPLTFPDEWERVEVISANQYQQADWAAATDDMLYPEETPGPENAPETSPQAPQTAAQRLLKEYCLNGYPCPCACAEHYGYDPGHNTYESDD